MMALRVPHPNALRPGHEHVSGGVHLHAVGNAFALFAVLVAENAAVAEFSVRKIVDADIALLAVVDIELLAVGRKCEAVRLREVSRQESHSLLSRGAFVQPVNTLKRRL